MVALPPALTLHELTRMYLAHAQVYYRRADGAPTREHLNLAASLKQLLELTGKTRPAASLSRADLRVYQQHLINRRLTRSYVNASMSRVRRFVAWSVAQDLLPASVLFEFAAVPALKRFRSLAPEGKGRTAVAAEHVAATLPHLPPTVRAVVQLLELTGARLGEILALRTSDINDADPETWWAIPPWHKTAHHGHRRAIPLDRRCQAILWPQLKPFAPDDPLFPSPQRPGRAYRSDSVSRCIARACRRAGVPTWTPHQIRHAVATKLRRTTSIDDAQALLGHARRSTTERYAPVMPHRAARAQEALQ